MSAYLWKYYLEDDVDNFRRVLADASSGPYAQKGGTGRAAGGGGGQPHPMKSPILVPQNRKSSGNVPTTPASGGRTQSSPLILNRAAINAKDEHGLTLLHHIASNTSENAIHYAQALLEHPLVDLYMQDIESAWTALHRALYFGNISVARLIIARDTKNAVGNSGPSLGHNFGGLIKIKDKEGNTPFEVFNATIANRILDHERLHMSGILIHGDDEDVAHGDSVSMDGEHGQTQTTSLSVEGDEVFTFGSNKNLTLGFGNEDDRQFPERITIKRPEHLLWRFYREFLDAKSNTPNGFDEDLTGSGMLLAKGISSLPSLIKSKPILTHDVVMSKLHTAVITTDPESNLYMFGFGPGGRLGTGDQTTRFNFTCIEGGALSGKKVVSVGLGQNHTLAVTDDGEILSWGTNTFGQLGYSLPKPSLKDEEPIQLLPRQIFGPLKREVIVGAAASRIHSVVHTETALFTFGKNEGQLGLVDSDARSLEMQTIPRRVAASLFSTPIQMVSALDRATICLLENHDVWVFANYGYAKVPFPLVGFSLPGFDTFRSTRYDATPNHITKIASGGDTIAAMSKMGEVWTLNIGQNPEGGPTASSTTNPTKIRNALSQPRQVWYLRKDQSAVTDIDVGQDGSIIFCTAAGSVWRRIKRATIKDAKSKQGDYKSKDYKAARVPHLTRVTNVRSNTFGAYAAIRRDCDVTQTQILVGDKMLWSDIAPLSIIQSLADSRSNQGFSEGHSDISAIEVKRSLDRVKELVLHDNNFESTVKEFIEHFDSSEQNYNVEIMSTVSEVCLPVHRFMLTGRSPVLRHLFLDLDLDTHEAPSVAETLSLSKLDDGRIRVTLQGADFVTLLNFVFYVYHDEVVGVWHYTRQAPKSAFRYRQIRAELMKIASRLEMRGLEASVRGMVTPERVLHSDMDRAILDEAFFADADIQVDLAASEMKAHSALMCQRCPFFEGLFMGRAGGRWLSSRRELLEQPTQLVKVDLQHIEPEVFKLVLRFLYSDCGEEMFDDIVTADLDEFLDLIMEVMSVANELMLDRLSQICQKMLGRFINTRNACQLVNAVAPCAVTEFKDAGLEYICLNLEVMLENRHLDELDEDLLAELDQVVRENQLACLPIARSGRAEALLLERHPGLAEAIQQDRQAKIEAMTIKARQADEDVRLSSSFKAKFGSLDGLSSSPSQLKARRRSSKEAKRPSSSPMLRPKASTTDLPFLMDEDEEESSKDSSAVTSPKFRAVEASVPPSPRYGSLGSSMPKADVWYDSKGKPLSPEVDPLASPPSPLTLPVASRASGRGIVPLSIGSPVIGGTSTPPKPWGSVPLNSAKLDMKDIMAQASSSRTSNISLGLSSQSKASDKAFIATPAKLSQKERKRQQQTQHVEQAQPATPSRPAPPSRNPSSPWQSATKTPAISLKNVLNQENQNLASSVRPAPQARPLTMRQTVANPGASGLKTPPITPQPSAPASQQRPGSSPNIIKGPIRDTKAVVSTSAVPPAPTPVKGFRPMQSTPPPTAPPPIRSVRHVQTATSTEPSLQLSMADILSQQQAEKDIIREATAKRSLQEIQQEQEFQEWWDQESRRVMLEEKERNTTSRRGGGARGRGRGGKGRGGSTRGGAPGRDRGGHAGTMMNRSE